MRPFLICLTIICPQGHNLVQCLHLLHKSIFLLASEDIGARGYQPYLVDSH